MSSMNQDDHPAHNIPDATEHYDGVQLAGDVVPLKITEDKFDKAMSGQINNNKSMSNIANQGPSGVDTTNLKLFRKP